MVKTPLPPTPIETFITWIGSVPSVIVHSIIFVCFGVLAYTMKSSSNTILLIWNTAVSLEAIYLAIFIQFTVNRNTASLREVEEDIDEIQEDVEELGEDLDEIQEDIEEMSEDVEEMQKDVDEIQEDIEELNEDEAEAEKAKTRDKTTDRLVEVHARTLEQLTMDMRQILTELESLKKQK